MKTALVCGISGQDGVYLSRLLLEKGYRVHGTSRDPGRAATNLARLGIADSVGIHAHAATDYDGLAALIDEIRPDEVYNLAGQSSVALSFEHPFETMDSIATATLHLLEAVRRSGRPIRLFGAGSGECFGDTGGLAVTEETAFRPRSPYAVAKAAAFWHIATYRQAFGVYACTGLLFNHESPLRPERFVTRKIVAAAVRIANGSSEKLRLGNTAVRRDWGWAPEYVDAMWRMLQQATPADYVIATGETHGLDEFVERAFAEVGLDWRDHVEVDAALVRPADVPVGRADPSRAERELGWRATRRFADVVREMVRAEQLAAAPAP